jgi:uncharacterized protein DUF2846
MSWRGLVFWRGVLFLIVAMPLSGCVSDRAGFDYAAIVQKVGPPHSGQSRIVVLSEKATGIGMDSALCDLKVDGGPASRLKPGTYVYADRPAGRHELVATQTLFPGETKHDVTTVSGRTYFFVAKNSERSRALTGMAMVGGLAGALVASAATAGSDNPGPVDLYPLDEAAARTTIAELQLAE